MFGFEDVAMPPTMVAVDIGAMLSGDADPYARLNKLGLLNVIGFEPQISECQKLNALAIPGRIYLPYAIGDGTRQNFYTTSSSMTSSLLHPNLKFVDHFVNLPELMQVVSTSAVDTVRLDDVPEIALQGCDLLKIDTQGTEATILSHSSRILDECLIVESEVEFVPLYEDQPLFADVDQLLRAKGFMLHRFKGLAGRTYKPFMFNNDPTAALSQTLWSDAIYVRDLMRLEDLKPDSLIKLAALLHEIYASYDLCHVVLSAHDRKCGMNYANKYFELLRNL